MDGKFTWETESRKCQGVLLFVDYTCNLLLYLVYSRIDISQLTSGLASLKKCAEMSK